MVAHTCASVKRPSTLAERAHRAAQPTRRSVASPIEHRATLGEIVEPTGLNVQETRAATGNAKPPSPIAKPQPPSP